MKLKVTIFILGFALLTNCGFNKNSTERAEISSSDLLKVQSFSADSVETVIEETDNAFNFSSKTDGGATVMWTIYRVVNSVLHHDHTPKFKEVAYNTGLGGKSGYRMTPWYSKNARYYNEYVVYAFNPVKITKKYYTPMQHLTFYSRNSIKESLKKVSSQNGQLPNNAKTAILSTVSYQGKVKSVQMTHSELLKMACDTKHNNFSQEACNYGKQDATTTFVQEFTRDNNSIK